MKYLERSKECIVLEVHSDNSSYLQDIKKLSYKSHQPVRIIDSRGLQISLETSHSTNKPGGPNKRCKLVVSDTISKVKEMTQKEIKVNEENFYTVFTTNWSLSLRKVCLSSVGIEIRSKESRCSEWKPNNHIKIPVIFTAYQPYIGW